MNIYCSFAALKLHTLKHLIIIYLFNEFNELDILLFVNE